MSGLELLRSRAASLPGWLRTLAESPASFHGPGHGAQIGTWLARGGAGAVAHLRAVVATGIGSSRAHAEFLAECLAGDVGWPARFAATGSLAAAPPPGSENDLLVVFSQGLSPNARFALQHVERWGAVVLVTAEPLPGSGPVDDAQARGGGEAQADKRRWLAALEARGVRIVTMPGTGEYGTLVRVVGPVAGFAVALRLAREMAAQRGGVPDALHWDAEAAAEVFGSAGDRLAASLGDQRIGDLLKGEIVFVATGGHAQAAQHLSTRFAEGLWIPRPGCWDALEFAHGPLQQAYERPASVIFLARDGAQDEDAWIERVRAVLVPERHRMIVWRATLPGRSAIFEHEALAIEFMLRALEERGDDPAEWPGKGADAPLYDVTPAPLPATPASHGDVTPAPRASAPPRSLAIATHPEVEAFVAGGARTALVPLGSTEQHGPHLPFATDTWIAEAVAARFCARRDDAIALPALPFGCASEHMDFVGTLDLRLETLEQALADLLRSLARHGFARALVFSAHGGNAEALGSLASALCDVARPMRVAVHSDLAGLAAALRAASAAEGVAAEASGHHAGESETSILLAIAPDAVRRDRLAAGLDAPVDAQHLFYPSLRAHAPSGVVGDPRSASAERGGRYLDAWVNELERFAARAFR